MASADRFTSVLRSGCFNDHRPADICEELQKIVTFIYENPCSRDYRKPGNIKSISQNKPTSPPPRCLVVFSSFSIEFHTKHIVLTYSSTPIPTSICFSGENVPKNGGSLFGTY